MEAHERMEFELAVDQIKKMVPMLLGVYPTIAKLEKAYFNYLVKSGFNEDQALHIVLLEALQLG